MGLAFRHLLLCALLVRALVPAGFMPSAAADGHGLTLVICNGSGELLSVTPDDGQQVPSKSEGGSHEPCAFAGHVALTAPAFEVTTLLSMPETEEGLNAGSDVVLPPARAGPPLGSRAPPNHS
ncbi:MAG: DUF2946 family protein [Hyphomicrobiaceae bacterium]